MTEAKQNFKIKMKAENISKICLNKNMNKIYTKSNTTLIVIYFHIYICTII